MKMSSVKLLDLTLNLSIAMDLMSPVFLNHHSRVAYICTKLATELGIKAEEQKDLLLGALLHDIGVFSFKKRLELLKFELKDPHDHAETGYHLLKDLPGFATSSNYVRFHHIPWDKKDEFEVNCNELFCHIIHLAERLDVLIHHKEPILNQLTRICKTIKAESGKKFSPKVVECFMQLADKEYFWLDIVSSDISKNLAETFLGSDDDIFNINEMINFSKVFSRIIDFRSPYMISHSRSVSNIATALAKIAGLSHVECKSIQIAGYLHDIGKLTVPSEILGKPGKLSQQEFNIIKMHPYYTYKILKSIKGVGDLSGVAGHHHERLDGAGYPFHLSSDELSKESKIMAVADVFSGITEDRPHRKGMGKPEASTILKRFASHSVLDEKLVYSLIFNYGDVDNGRASAQMECIKEYKLLQQL